MNKGGKIDMKLYQGGVSSARAQFWRDAVAVGEGASLEE
jgi:hypothetical protein